jgi:hypothetical protein
MQIGMATDPEGEAAQVSSGRQTASDEAGHRCRHTQCELSNAVGLAGTSSYRIIQRN